VPEAMPPCWRRGTEIAVAGAQAHAIGGGDHQRHDGPVGMLDGLRQRAWCQT
jgi:hypothetical protein